MGVPDITIIVRHSKDCDYRDDASYRNCRCRKHLRWFANGKQRQETAGTRSWSQAEAAKHRKIDQLMGKPVGPDPLATKQTVRASVDGFLKAKKVRDITLDAYQRYEIELNRLITFCEGTGVYAIEALTLPVLIAYKATWPDIYPSSTTRSIVQKRLNGFLKFCRDAGYITVLPKLDPVKITEPPTLPLSDEEFNRLLAAVPEEFTNGNAARVRALILLMRWSGLAVRDASTLQVGQLLRTKTTYSVVTARQKTGTHVMVPIPEDVALEILALPTRNGYYFDQNRANDESLAKVRSQEITRVFNRAKIHSKGAYG
jgi:integrase/recombinase XerD